MNDDLFRPTITARTEIVVPPWRPDSIIYPAFFGGPLAATVLGLLNARRLALGRKQLLTVAAVGVTCIVARLVVTGLLDGQVAARVLGGLAGIAVWAVITATQKKTFRAYEYGDGEPASLVGPGIAAAVGCGLIENILIAVVVN